MVGLRYQLSTTLYSVIIFFNNFAKKKNAERITRELDILSTRMKAREYRVNKIY